MRKLKDKQLQVNKAWRDNNKEKRRAQKLVELNLRYNRIIRPDKCSLCQTYKRVFGHHVDYTKPLEVLWVCMSCHRLIHTGKIKVDDVVERR